MELAFESSPVPTALTLAYKALKEGWRLFTNEELAFVASPLMLFLTSASRVAKSVSI